MIKADHFLEEGASKAGIRFFLVNRVKTKLRFTFKSWQILFFLNWIWVSMAIFFSLAIDWLFAKIWVSSKPQTVGNETQLKYTNYWIRIWVMRRVTEKKKFLYTCFLHRVSFCRNRCCGFIEQAIVVLGVVVVVVVVAAAAAWICCFCHWWCCRNRCFCSFCFYNWKNRHCIEKKFTKEREGCFAKERRRIVGMVCTMILKLSNDF